MRSEFWLDGFNFFHHWDKTKALLRPDSGYDIVKAMNRAIGILGRSLGSRCSATVVFMDGGLDRHDTGRGAMRLRYAGPGKKADDRMAAEAEFLGPDAGLITAVSNDRELKDRLRMLGVTCIGVGEFLSLIEGKKPGRAQPGKKRGNRAPGGKAIGGKSEEAEILREKCRNLSPSEVKAWLEFFGGDMEV
ncbi:MAG: hypothetical protein LIP23_08300 [Planctomycetes bacterium]|nr:hypothetical protein [Planctomycetota bacterium]